VPVPGVLQGRLAARRPSAPIQRLEQEAAFIDERDDSFTSPPLF
jgi:hypothetical protein